MLYIIGLGLNEKGISIEGNEILKKCKKIYLENYTIEFPYKIKKLEKIIGKKINILNREYVEGNKLILESKNSDIALLVYGSPLSATTHITLVEECIENKIKYKIVYAGSVFDAIAESGLQLYKFGKIASMPLWKNNFKPESFIDLIKENQSINAHSLILIDIELNFNDALNQLIDSSKNKKINIEEILVCSQLGLKSKFFYGKINKFKNKKFRSQQTTGNFLSLQFGTNEKNYSKLEDINPNWSNKKIKAPFCFVIPGKMHFLEEKMIERFKLKDIVIKKSKIGQFKEGIFANRDFKKGEIVIKYNLKKLSKKEFENLSIREKRFVHSHYGIIYLYSSPERYVNHSSSPNTFQDLKNKCDISIRNIKEGEEITTDSSKDDIEK